MTADRTCTHCSGLKQFVIRDYRGDVTVLPRVSVYQCRQCQGKGTIKMKARER